MQFVIYREVEVRGKKTRKALVEWDEKEIIAALKKEVGKNYDYGAAAYIETAFNNVIREFKKESIKIP